MKNFFLLLITFVGCSVLNGQTDEMVLSFRGDVELPAAWRPIVRTEEYVSAEHVVSLIDAAVAQKGKVTFFKRAMPSCFDGEFEASYSASINKYADRSLYDPYDELLFQNFTRSVFLGTPFFQKLINGLAEKNICVCASPSVEHPSPSSLEQGKIKWETAALTSNGVWNLEKVPFTLRLSRKTKVDNLESPKRFLTKWNGRVVFRQAFLAAGDFYPVCVSRDLKRTIGFALNEKGLPGTYYWYDLSSNVFIRIDGLPNDSEINALSGDGTTLALTRNISSSSYCETMLLRDGVLRRAYCPKNGESTIARILSFDGRTLLVEYWNPKKLPGPRAALVQDGSIDILAPFGKETLSAISSRGEFLSSNGLIVAGSAYDDVEWKIKPFIKEAGKPMRSISGPLLLKNASVSLSAMSSSGLAFAGLSTSSCYLDVPWLFFSGRYELLLTDVERNSKLVVCFVSNDARVIFGHVLRCNGDSDPFIARDGQIVFINEIISGKSDFWITDILGCLEDGSCVLCSGYDKDLGCHLIIANIAW